MARYKRKPKPSVIVGLEFPTVIPSIAASSNLPTLAALMADARKNVTQNMSEQCR